MSRNRRVQVVTGNGFPLTAKKVYPNDPCTYGSGKKAKKCCGTEKTYYYTKKKETDGLIPKKSENK